MEREYTLYKVEIINDIPMWEWMSSIHARNIVDAEFKATPLMEINKEYIITLKK